MGEFPATNSAAAPVTDSGSAQEPDSASARARELAGVRELALAWASGLEQGLVRARDSEQGPGSAPEQGRALVQQSARERSVSGWRPRSTMPSARIRLRIGAPVSCRLLPEVIAVRRHASPAPRVQRREAFVQRGNGSYPNSSNGVGVCRRFSDKQGASSVDFADLNQHGLQSAPPHQPTFFQRLFGRPIKKNAVIEITNLLAENPIKAVSLPQVADILKRYDLGFGEVMDSLLAIYRRVLAHVAADRELSANDRADLTHLQMILNLPDDGVVHRREEVLGDLYANSLAGALADGSISPEERTRLDGIAASFQLPAKKIEEVYRAQVLKLLQWQFNEILKDQRVTDAEEAHLREMAANFGVTMTHGSETQRLYDRCRLLARIEAGQLPAINAAITLQRGETCHASLDCTHNEIRKQTTSYRYSGPTASVKIIGPIRWRFGQVSLNRVSRDVMTQLDSGTLYVTNKRLLFDGAQNSKSIALKKIIRFTVFSDGIKIEKDTGKDQYFIGSGDSEVLGAVLERVIAQSR